MRWQDRIMNNTVSMKRIQSHENLFGDASHLCLRHEWDILLDHVTRQVALVHILHDQIGLVSLMDAFDKVHNVLDIFESPQELSFLDK